MVAALLGIFTARSTPRGNTSSFDGERARLWRGYALAMFGEMLDTSPAQQAAYYARLQRLTVGERAALLSRLCRGVRKLAEAGVRAAHPEYGPDEVRRAIAVRLYGEPVAQRLFGPPRAAAP